jgi:hypothetical protein
VTGEGGDGEVVRLSALDRVRIAIAVVGILLPYLARIPGVFAHGQQWLTSYFGTGTLAILFFGAFNAINWGAILVGTLFYRSVAAALLAAVLGFAPLAVAHSTIDLSADAQAAIALVILPIFSLPFVVIAWLLGFAVDRILRRRDQNPFGAADIQ